MENKNLIIVFSQNDQVFELTEPSIRKYAEKINCDFKKIESNNEWDKFKVKTYFETYQRILLLNENIIIRQDCPDLFEIVPKTHVGLFEESRYAFRISNMKNIFDNFDYDIEKWDGKYYNSGVILFSRSHTEFFKTSNSQSVDFESFLNFIISKNKIKVHDITYKFNRTHYIDKFIGMTRLDSYVIHYKDAPNSIIKDHIIKDLNSWSEDFPHFNYKQNIVFSVSAGMGDQICSEPVIRHAQKMFSDSNLHILTHFPRLFSHLDIPTYTYDEWQGLEEAYLKLYTCPDEKDSDHNLSHVMFHPTDFASLSTIRKTIPNHDKTIKLGLNPDDTMNVLNLFKDKDPTRPLVLVHAGKWWPSKTLPQEWWQEIVDKLSEKLTVCLIGKTIDEHQGFLPIECPKGGYDLRDMTTLSELFSLISISKVVLTNDSSPLHIAGAFDNWIVTIPTCKHPDHILPYRNGSQYYKTKALYKKLLLNDLEIRHTEIKTDTIDTIPEGKTLYEYIPEVDDVIKEVFDIYDNHD